MPLGRKTDLSKISKSDMNRIVQALNLYCRVYPKKLGYCKLANKLHQINNRSGLNEQWS